MLVPAPVLDFRVWTITTVQQMSTVVDVITKNVLGSHALECRVTKMTIARQMHIVVECMRKNVHKLAWGWDVEAIRTAPLENAAGVKIYVPSRSAF